MVRIKKKWRNLDVGGTEARNNTKANLPCKESGRFSEVYLVVFGFWWGPVGSGVGDPPPGIEDGVG